MILSHYPVSMGTHRARQKLTAETDGNAHVAAPEHTPLLLKLDLVQGGVQQHNSFLFLLHETGPNNVVLPEGLLCHVERTRHHLHHRNGDHQRRFRCAGEVRLHFRDVLDRHEIVRFSAVQEQRPQLVVLRRHLVVLEDLPPKRNRRVERKLPSKRHMHRRTAGPDGPRVRQRLHAPAHLRLHADEPAALGVPRIEPAVGGVL